MARASSLRADRDRNRALGTAIAERGGVLLDDVAPGVAFAALLQALGGAAT